MQNTQISIDIIRQTALIYASTDCTTNFDIPFDLTRHQFSKRIHKAIVLNLVNEDVIEIIASKAVKNSICRNTEEFYEKIIELRNTRLILLKKVRFLESFLIIDRFNEKNKEDFKERIKDLKEEIRKIELSV